MSVKRNLLSFLVILFAIFIGPTSKVILLLGLYYILVAIVYISIGKIYDSSHTTPKRNTKRIRKILQCNQDYPDAINRMKTWLLREGFKHKMSSYNTIYLQSKTVRIEYYAGFGASITITPVRSKDRDHLIYEQDEELQKRLKKYLSYLLGVNKEIIDFEEKYKVSDSSKKSIEQITSNFLEACVRIQGYIFVIVILLHIPEDYCATFYKIVVFFSYLTLENTIGEKN